jgi:type I restriction enzyme S subunit
MTGGVVDFKRAGKINAEARRRIRKGVGAPGDVILSHKGTVGRVAVAPLDSPEYVCSPQTTFWRSLDHDVLDQRYLKYILQSANFQRQLATLGGQTDMAPYVSLTDQRSMELDLIPLAEQRAIAAVLGAIDDKIAVNERVLRASDDLARAMVARDASDGVRVRIADIASAISRGVAPSYVTTGGMTVLNQKCVRDRRVDLSHARRMKPNQRGHEKLLRRDDLLINSTGQGTLGRVGRWIFDTVEATVDSHITIVRFDDDVADPAFAGVASLGLERQIELLAEGSTGQTELRRDLLGKLELRLPPLAAQRARGQHLRLLDDESVARRKESVLLASALDELLPQLMSGRVTVNAVQEIVKETR